MQRNAWLAAPSEISRYGGFLAILGGAVFVGRGWHEITSERTDVVTINARGYSPHGGGALNQASGRSAQVLGGVDLSFGLVLVGVGAAALLVRRR